jgi:aspartate-semialdehyde dehydrogenase
MKLAVVGADTLLGREVQEILRNRLDQTRITAFSASGEGNFGEQEGEAVYLEPLDARTAKDHDILISAGSEAGAQKAYAVAKAAEGRLPVLDCTGYLDQLPEARIIAPLFEPLDARPSWLLVLAHPAASALGLTLYRLARYRQMQRAVAHIFEPASERGKRGVAELHQQTTSLLSFKSLEKGVFDAQLGFNLLSQYGAEAPHQLATFEQRIERHIATLLSRADGVAPIPMPSLRLIQAPVFHGYSISLWIEFVSEVRVGELEEALESAPIEVRRQNEEAPHTAEAVNQSGLLVGDIRVDRNNPRAAWFWIVGDNLRLMADAVAETILSLQKQPL